MNNIKIYLKTLFLIIVLLNSDAVFSQQSVITMPSSAVLNAGEMIIKDSNRFGVIGDKDYYSITPQIILGTGHDTEMSLEARTKIKPDDTSLKLNITAKKVFKVRESMRFTAGGVISPYLTDGKNPDSMLYAHAAYICSKTKTTVTAGAYLRGKSQMPSLMGVMVGVDQTIIPDKLRIAADWVSREDSWGMFGVGLKARPVKSTWVTTAILIPNNHKDNIGIQLSVSKSLGKVIPERKPKEEL